MDFANNLLFPNGFYKTSNWRRKTRLLTKSGVYGGIGRLMWMLLVLFVMNLCALANNLSPLSIHLYEASNWSKSKHDYFEPPVNRQPGFRGNNSKILKALFCTCWFLNEFPELEGSSIFFLTGLWLSFISRTRSDAGTSISKQRLTSTFSVECMPHLQYHCLESWICAGPPTFQIILLSYFDPR